MNKLKLKAISFFFHNNSRYILAGLILLFTFLLNIRFFTRQTITADSCRASKCQAASIIQPSLSRQFPNYFVDNIFQSAPGKYYQLVFSERTDKNVKINISAMKNNGENMPVKSLDLFPNNQLTYQEIIFKTDGEYSSLLFSLSGNDDANIYMDDVRIFPLNIQNDQDISALKPATIGNIDLDVISTSQTSDSSYKFPLDDPNTSIGQIFKSQDNYISEVAFNIDINKENGNSSSREYQLELRPADFDGQNIRNLGSPIAAISFSVANDIEKYRQPDGTFRFPVFSSLEKGKYYYIGINNAKVDVDSYNYLVFRGSKSKNVYTDGVAAIKKGKIISGLPGNLFFQVYGAKYNEINNERLLSGAAIIDQGNGTGLYSYETKGQNSDILDLYSSSGLINFDPDKKVIHGLASENSNFIYQFNTVYPFKKFNFSAEQAQSGWHNSKVFYSFDNNNWAEIPFQMTSGLQEYNYDILGNSVNNKVYIKVAYDPSDAGKGKNYGLKNLKVTGNLLIK